MLDQFFQISYACEISYPQIRFRGHPTGSSSIE